MSTYELIVSLSLFLSATIPTFLSKEEKPYCLQITFLFLSLSLSFMTGELIIDAK